jgi:hypothetical protein
LAALAGLAPIPPKVTPAQRVSRGRNRWIFMKVLLFERLRLFYHIPGSSGPEFRRAQECLVFLYQERPV